jgi:hypothetical protein
MVKIVNNLPEQRQCDASLLYPYSENIALFVLVNLQGSGGLYKKKKNSQDTQYRKE